MPDIRLADVSEWQPNIDAAAYLAGGYRTLIVRAHSGYRPDKMMPARRDYLRGFPFAALGYYQYLAHDRDAAQQARELVSTVGPLRANEFLVLDHEEGAGNQIARADAWFAVVDQAIGFKATLYAGYFYCRDHLDGWGRWANRPRWLAAYSTVEPGDPHELWQNTDAARFPGLSGTVDGNIFHGDERRFAAVFTAGRGTVAPAPPKPADGRAARQSMASVLKPGGGREVFVELASGEVKHTWSDGGRWVLWRSLGTPGKR